MFSIITDYPVALDSPDHIMPFGTVQNSSSNIQFNNKLYELFDNKQLSIMDIGCAGGGFVKDCLSHGHEAIGIEGSDACKKENLHEWSNIPDNLFTCDVTHPFTIQKNGEGHKFDVITCWEFMEHPLEERLPVIFDNIHKHLTTDGVWIMSINVASPKHVSVIQAKGDCGPGELHQNVKSPEWWDNKFESNGFLINSEALNTFDGQFVRSPGCGCCEYATEEAYNLACNNEDVPNQWATINRFLELV